VHGFAALLGEMERGGPRSISWSEIWGVDDTGTRIHQGAPLLQFTITTVHRTTNISQHSLHHSPIRAQLL